MALRGVLGRYNYALIVTITFSRHPIAICASFSVVRCRMKPGLLEMGLLPKSAGGRLVGRMLAPPTALLWSRYNALW
jgi:hypothetical protein